MRKVRRNEAKAILPPDKRLLFAPNGDERELLAFVGRP